MSDSILWYATRGAGIVSLILLTAVMCLGILTTVRWQRPGWPRFLSAELHSNVALLSIIFLVIHIVIAVVDPFTALGWASAFVPFSSDYRTLWLGLGVWRLVHWIAYLCWPVALLHGIGTGSDTGAPWLWLVDAACIVAVLGATAWRFSVVPSPRSEHDAVLPPPARRS